MPEQPKSPAEFEDVSIEPVSRNEAKRLHRESPLNAELAENLDKPGALIPGLAKLGTMAIRWMSRQIFQEPPAEAPPKTADPAGRGAFSFDSFLSPTVEKSGAESGGKAKFTGTLDETLAEIRRLVAANQPRAALPLAQDLALEHPENSQPRVLIAACFTAMGDAPRAVSLLDAVTREDKAPAEAFLRLGEARRALGDNRQAKVAFLRCAAATDKDDPACKLAQDILRDYGDGALTCDGCQKKLEPGHFHEVGGRLLCIACENAARAEIAEQVRAATAGGQAALVDLKRKKNRRLLIKTIGYALLLISAGMTACYFASPGCYRTIRQYLGLIGRYLPEPRSDPSNPRGSQPTVEKGVVKSLSNTSGQQRRSEDDGPGAADSEETKGKDAESDGAALSGDTSPEKAAPAVPASVPAESKVADASPPPMKDLERSERPAPPPEKPASPPAASDPPAPAVSPPSPSAPPTVPREEKRPQNSSFGGFVL